MEDVLLESLKKLLSTPGLVDHWLDVYAKSTSSEIPALEGRLKAIESEIEAKNKRVQNLVARIADLPSEVPAEMFYEHIKETNQKINELKATRQELLAKSTSLKAQTIDKAGLVEKIQNTIAHLEKTPVERRRPLYSNLIEFAEIHPTKLRVGVIAPALSQKATGTEGVGFGPISKFQDFEPRNHLTLATRGGSTTVTIGAP